MSDNVGGNDATYERWSGIIDILCGNNGGMPFLRHDSFYKSAAANHVNTMGIVGYQNWSIISGIRFTLQAVTLIMVNLNYTELNNEKDLMLILTIC